MFRPPPDRAGGRPIDIVPFPDDDHGDDAADVSFGARRRRPEATSAGRRRPRWWIAAGVLFVAAAIVAASRNDSRSSSSTATLPEVPTASRTPAPTEAAAASTTPSAAVAAAAALAHPAPLAANAPRLGLYLAGEHGVTRIDLSTGISTAVPAPAPGQAIGVVGVDAAIVPVTLGQLGDHPIAAALGRDGTAWTVGGEPPTLHHVAIRADGSVAPLDAGVAVPPIGFDTYLVGLSSSGNPVLQLRDNRAYEVDPATGSLRRIATGVVNDVQHGFFAETECGADGRCIERLHGSGDVFEFPAPNGFTQASFSPDGTKALFVETMEVGPIISLIDLRAGTRTRLPTDVLVGDAKGIAWTPDGSEVFRVGLSRRTGEASFARVDTSTGVAAMIPVTGFDATTTLVGLG